MTEKIDLLSVEQPKSSTKASSSTETKKEGSSLFDSMLANSKKEIANKDDSTKSSEEIKTEEKTSTTQVVDSKKENKSEESNTKETSKVDSKSDNKTTNADTEPEKNASNDKAESKDKTSENTVKTGGSLLDRLVLEAKKNIKTVSKDEFDKLTKPNLDNKGSKNSSASSDIETPLENKNLVKTDNTTNTLVENKDKLSDNPIDGKTEDTKTETTKDNKTSKSDTNTELKETKDNNNTSTKTNITQTPNTDKLLNSENNIDSEIKSTLDTNTQNSNKTDLKTEALKVISEDSFASATKVLADNKNIKTVESEVKNNILDSKANTSSQVVQNDIESSPDIKKDIQNTSSDIKTVKTTDENSDESLIKQPVKSEVKEQDSKTEVKNLKVETANTNANTKTSSENLNETNDVKKDLNTSNTSKNIDTNTTNTSLNSKTEDSSSKNLSKLDKETLVKDEQRVNVDKNITATTKTETVNKSDDNKSLMDKLLESANKNVKQVSQEEVTKATKEVVQTSKSADVVTNIYLGAQKNSIYNQMLATKSEGLKLVKEEGGVEAVKAGANVLDLGLEDASVELEENLKTDLKSDVKTTTQATKDLGLERLILSRNARYDDSSEIKTTSTTTTTNTSGVATTTTTNSNGEQTVTVNVNPALALSIQNRIIGAQQQMTTMLSDVAKQMYENYKPPITAFKINLNPSNLGSIAIMMRNERDNGISISLNMSSASTLDAFVEGQASLRDALNRNFNNSDTSFNLDFGMQEESSNNSQGQENPQDNKQETLASSDILETISNTTEDLEEKIEYL